MRAGFLGYSLAAVLAAGVSTRAVADEFFGGLVGGMIGAAIMQGANQPQQQAKPRAPRASVSSAERARNVEVQTALNHFAFPTGTPDGVLGRKSRAAIGQYQALLGFAVTGNLTETERQILITAYQRSLVGGSQVTRIVANDPLGLRALLVAQRDEMLGLGNMARSDYGGLPPQIAEAVDEVARNSGLEGAQLVQRAGFIQLADMNGDGRSDYLMDTSVTGSGFWCTGDACQVRVFLTTPEGFKRNDFQLADPVPASFQCALDICRLSEAPQTELAATPEAEAEREGGDGTMMVAQPGAAQGGTALPSFAAGVTSAREGFAAHCAGVAGRTAASGGALQTVGAITDPAQALGEQFCLVAAAAQQDGAALMAQVQGFTADQIAQQCAGFAAALGPQVANVATEGRDAALASVQTWLGNAAMPQDQLVATARICLSVGYGRDDGAMALASALALAGTGNLIYGEFIGHHLAAGVAVARNPERALEWFSAARHAAEAGQMPVIPGGAAERVVLIEQAAAAVAGKTTALPLLPVVPASGAVAP